MNRDGNFKALFLLGGVLLICAALAGVWRWSSLSELLDFKVVAHWLDAVRSHPLAPYIIIGAFLIGSQIMFPITVLILATAYTFGPWLGFIYAMAGSVLGAVLTYSIGYFMGHNTFKRIAGRHYEALDKMLKKNGLIAVITTHLLPVGPFTIVNLGAGAVHARFWDFILGCAIGLLPGVTLITIFEHQLERALRKPGIETVVILSTFAVAIAAWFCWARRQARI